MRCVLGAGKERTGHSPRQMVNSQMLHRAALPYAACIVPRSMPQLRFMHG
jgi:hypothetical protein